MSNMHQLMMPQEGDVNMIADIGSFAAAAVHPTMVAPAGPTHDVVNKFLLNIGAQPASKLTADLS